ncbi:GNAT family N-acetyltransferase [Saccharopolyspora taberi]|uniref:GNAT family N-acetyltransferase n=1 Tax=Saccharopolyspora taberi TaxID=60895 RepID=A0ABN3VDR8_9PSEU
MSASLTTPRLELTRWTGDDLRLLTTLVSDPLVVRHIRDQEPWSAEFTRERHDAALEHWSAHGFGWRAIRWRHDGTAVGMVSVSHRPVGESVLGRPAVELGWLLAPPAWGKGVATEAVRAARDHAFGHTDVVYAQYQTGNDVSGRIMTKLGMTHHADRTDSDGVHTHLHVLTRTDWAALR